MLRVWIEITFDDGYIHDWEALFKNETDLRNEIERIVDEGMWCALPARVSGVRGDYYRRYPGVRVYQIDVDYTGDDDDE